MPEYITKDSGQREHFKDGAMRDRREGKGRYDLLSPIALKRLAGLYERGSLKYDDRNWEKGMPMTRVFDSMIRHAYQWLAGEGDEDHLAAVAWGAFALMHFEALRPDLDDRPEWTVKEDLTVWDVDILIGKDGKKVMHYAITTDQRVQTLGEARIQAVAEALRLAQRDHPNQPLLVKSATTEGVAQ